MSGGITLELEDPERLIDPSQVTFTGTADGYTVSRARWSESREAWRFLVLRKRGALEMGSVFSLTTTEEFDALPLISEACDTSAAPLPASEFRAELLEVD